MAFDRPTLPQLIERIKTDISGRMAGVDPRLRRSILGVLARVEAGVAHGLYGYLDWLARQIMPDSAESEILDRWASWWGIVRKAASPAFGEVDFAGVDGSVIAAGTVLQRPDGAEYTVDTEVTVIGGTAVATVTASVAGQDGNSAAGVALALVSPVAGVQPGATVAAAGLVGGADIEADEALRDRLRNRVQQPPQGGSVADYEFWAMDIPGVTRAWVMPSWLGIGTVGVLFVRDDDVDIIPDASEVQTVQDYIDGVRPVTADVTVLAPTAVAVDMTIKLTPNTAVVQAAVTTAITDLFRRAAQVEDGSGSGTILLSHIEEAVNLADGETDHLVVAPATDVTFAAGEIGVLGVITYQAM